MSKTADLRASRDKAGDRYRAAVEELHQAFVELAALDQALACGNVAGEALQTFLKPPDAWALAHPIYAPWQTLPNWGDEIQAKRNAHIAAVAA
jgi:hypothetical protein